MKKILVVGIILLFLGSNIPALAQTKESIHPLSHILYVGGTGPGNYTKIQDAINDSSNGDHVFVYHDSSPYYECLKINQSIMLQGENRDSTIIYGLVNHSYWNNIEIYANNVEVRDLTINTNVAEYVIYNFGRNAVFSNLKIHPIRDDNSSSYATAIWTGYTSNCLVQNCILSNCYEGVDIYDLGLFHFFYDVSHDNKVINSVISNCVIGIKSEGRRNIIRNNTITHCSEVGIEVLGPRLNLLIHNNISNCGEGIIITSDANSFISRHHTISLNKIQYCQLGIYIYGSALNRITKNDFLFNEKDAYFENCFRNHWESNYWGSPLSQPKSIEGLIIDISWGGGYWPYHPPEHFSLPGKNYDRYPASTPNYNS
jgi:parallel beta-helix repeat protein